MQDLKILKGIDNKLKFYFRPDSWDDNVIKAVASGNEYKATAKEGDVVVDIGGHIGSFTVLSASKGAKVFTYEPVKENYELLKKNLEFNKLKATVTNKAVVGVDRPVKMKINRQNMGSSQISEEGVTVKTITFDEVIAKHEQIDLLKMDCEGEEHKFDVAKHHEKIKTIVAEIHNDNKLTFIEKLRPFYDIKTYKSNAKDCYMIHATRK